jgi:hypothetical protein
MRTATPLPNSPIRSCIAFTDTLCIIFKVALGFLFLAMLVDVQFYYSRIKEQPNGKDEQAAYYSQSRTYSSTTTEVITTTHRSWKYIVDQIKPFLALALGILFFFWIYRINNYLQVHSERKMEFTPGWAVLWFFIPIANLFKPYQVMREIWQMVNHGKPIPNTAVGWWWATYIIRYSFGMFSSYIAVRIGIMESYTTVVILHVIAASLFIISNIFTLNLADRIGCMLRTGHLNQEQPPMQVK